MLKVTSPGAPTTTRQAEVLNTALIGSPTDERGLLVGDDTMSSSMVTHDQFTAYEDKKITSPNVVVLGMVGAGKSTLLKVLYVERPLLLRGRCAVVVDKKIRNGEGEYAEITREYGAEPFRFDPNEPETSTCMNPLDGIIRAAGGAAAQRQLLSAFAELAGSGELTEWHHKALAVAYRQTMRDFEDDRTPVMPDLLDRFDAVVDDPTFQRLPGGHPRRDRAGRDQHQVPVRAAAGGRPAGHVRPGNIQACAAAPEAHHVRRQRVTGGRAGDGAGDGDGELLADGDAGRPPPAGDAHQLRGRGRVASGGRARRSDHPLQIETGPRLRVVGGRRRSTTSATSRRTPTPPP